MYLFSEYVGCKVFIISVGLHPGAAGTDANGCFHQRLHRGAAQCCLLKHLSVQRTLIIRNPVCRSETEACGE